MAGIRKFFKKSGRKKGSSKEDLHSDAGSEYAFGYVIGKDKDLPKLHKAVWNRDTAKVKQLCKKFDINQFDKENRTPLHLAAAIGNEEVMKFLLANKAKTNLCDNDGRTALMKAIECSHEGCIRLLLDSNADVRVTDVNSSSTLHLAAANNLIDVAVLLLRLGISVNITDKEGFTPLHVACSIGHQDFVLFLLNENADVNCKDSQDRTPLMTAAADGHVDIVNILLENYADVTLKDVQGWKAADHAVMNGIHSCAKIIDDYEMRIEKKKETEDVEKQEKKPITTRQQSSTFTEALRSSSPVDDGLNFTFGGPAADKVSNDALRSEDSTSRQSEGDSWKSESEDEIPGKKVSLAAAFKKVERSESTLSDESRSRIPVRSPAKAQSSVSARSIEKVIPTSMPSKIPRPVSATPSNSGGIPSPDKTLSSRDKNSVLISPTSLVKSGRSRTLPVPPESKNKSPFDTSPHSKSLDVSSESAGTAGEVSGKSESQGGGELQEYLKASETSESENETPQRQTVHSPSFVSPRSDQSNRNLAKELGLSLSDTDLEENSVMSGEVSFNEMNANAIGKQEVLTSTLKNKDEVNEGDKRNPAAYLGLDLDSTISSVSDPDISGLSREDRKKCDGDGSISSKLTGVNEQSTKNKREDTDSNWDSSEDIPPTETEHKDDASLKPSKHDVELQAAVEKRRHALEEAENFSRNMISKDKGSANVDGDSESGETTESESEWEKERGNRKKKEIQQIKYDEAKRKAEIEKKKDDERRLQEEEERTKREIEREREAQKQEEWEREHLENEAKRQEVWEREKQERESELANSIKKELQEELGIEGDVDGPSEGGLSEILSEFAVDEDGTSLYGEKLEEPFFENLNPTGDLNKVILTNGNNEENFSHDPSSEPDEKHRNVDVVKQKSILAGNARGQTEATDDFMDDESSKWDTSEENDGEEDSMTSTGHSKNEVRTDDRQTDVLLVNGNDRGSGESKGSHSTFDDDVKRNKQAEEALIAEKIEIVSEDGFEDSVGSFISEGTNVDRDEVISKGKGHDTHGTNDDVGKIVKTPALKEDDIFKQQKEEDELLEAYKAQQEEILEQERVIQEDLAQKEEEKLEELRLQLQQRQEEERRKMAELDRQRKDREVAMQREREEYEREMKLKQEERKKAEEDWKRKEMERLRVVKEKEDESFARSKKLQSLLSQSDGNVLSSDMDDFAETKAERSLTDKHRTFVEGVANSAVIEIQKAQSRGHLADRSKEIKQRQLEAKADLEAVRSRTTKLNEPVLTASTNLGTYSTLPNNGNVSTGNEKAELNPRFEESSDWSASSEDERDRRMSPAKTPLSGGETGLGSSLSPGLSASRPLLLHTAPLLSSSPAIIDNSPALIQLRSSLRENKRQLEKAQEKFTLADAKAKQLESHSDDLQSKLEEAINQKSVVERELFELNEENRLLKHECLKSVEDKKIAEALIGTVRDQMKRSEEKLTKEMKLRRAVEESGKKLESERANMENALRHIAQENEDIKKLLEREKEQCRLKDELYREQKKRNEAILLESQKVSQNRSEMLARLENADEDRKSVEASSESFKEQLIHAKGEIGRLTSQLESLSKASQNELELFKNQLHQQNERNKRLEESLTRVRSDYDSQMTQMQSANFEQQNKLESEMSNRHSLQSEVMLLRSKLENTENEREEAHKTRMDAERQLHASRDELYKTKNSLEKELSSVKEAGRMTTLKLNTAENKISSLEAELQTANVMLAERTSQMTMNMHDIESKRSSIGKLEADLREEKDKNSRITARLETATYKIKDLENEESNLRRQLDFAMEKVRRQEENSQETEKKLNSTISEMKTDYEKTKGKVSENEQRLADAVEKYKEEMKQNIQKLQEKDEYARLLSQELAETAQKLSLAESSLEIQKKARDSLEEERDHLRQTLRTYEEQMTVKISENQLVNGHATSLKNELEHSRKVSEETNQRLATTAYDLENLEKIKVDLQEDVSKLKGERVKLEATLQEEKAKTNLLLKEIKESNEGRSHLESLLSEIKSSNINLEEKLRVESIDKIQLAREADEAKNLWESEVRARSKVGAKILEMEAKVEEWKAALEEEKKKTRKALEGRKVIKGKLDIYEKRANQHEKEVQTLKTQAKTYKRRLKDVLSGEKSPTVLQAQFNRDIQQYEAMISALRNQLREASDKLREESDLRISTERKGQQLEEDLEFSKAHSKDLSRQVQKLERKNGLMADEMQDLKAYFAENCVEKIQLDQMKLDLEAKSRIELNRKLAEVNAHLEEQALAREALERSRNEQEDFRIKDLEETISKLRKENDEYRSRLHLLEAKKDTVEAEAERLKDMYKTENKRKEKLNNLLLEERQKLADSNSMRNTLERSHSEKILRNSNSSPRIPQRISMDQKSPGRLRSETKDLLLESVDRELSKSIKRHLDTIPVNDPLDWWVSKDFDYSSSPLSTSNRQYLETLKRKYFV